MERRLRESISAVMEEAEKQVKKTDRQGASEIGVGFKHSR